ncbi:MAG: Clp protease N-terminal domain-containing protein [Dehalococcoidia bacterium]
MPDRSDLFTAPARRALALADDEARRLNHNFVGTQHLRLGILRAGSGGGALALASVGVELDRVRAAVDFLVGRGDRPVAGELEPAPPARKALAFAAEEARRLGRRRIGTHHLLLGLLRDDVGFTAATLRLWLSTTTTCAPRRCGWPCAHPNRATRWRATEPRRRNAAPARRRNSKRRRRSG